MHFSSIVSLVITSRFDFEHNTTENHGCLPGATTESLETSPLIRGLPQNFIAFLLVLGTQAACPFPNYEACHRARLASCGIAKLKSINCFATASSTCAEQCGRFQLTSDHIA